MSKQDVSSDIRALRRAARSAIPLFDCSRRVFALYCEWRSFGDMAICLDTCEEEAAFLMLIAEVLENPQ